MEEGALLRGKMMPEARVELARGCPRWILSPLRLPFRHSGAGSSEYSPRAETNSEPPHTATLPPALHSLPAIAYSVGM